MRISIRSAVPVGVFLLLANGVQGQIAAQPARLTASPVEIPAVTGRVHLQVRRLNPPKMNHIEQLYVDICAQSAQVCALREWIFWIPWRSNRNQ